MLLLIKEVATCIILQKIITSKAYNEKKTTASDKCGTINDLVTDV